MDIVPEKPTPERPAPPKPKKRIFVLNLQARFILITLVILGVATSALTVILLQNNTSVLRTNLTERSKAFSTLATKQIGETFLLYQNSGTVLIDSQVKDFLALDKNVTGIAVVDLTGQVRYSYYVPVADTELPTITPAMANTFSEQYQYEESVLKTVIAPFFENNRAHSYSVVYSISSKSVDAAIQREVIAILIFSVVALVAIALTIFLLVRKFILSPVSQLSEQTLRISQGNLTEEIHIKRHDEIGRLGEAVNKMAVSLKNDIYKLQELDLAKTEFMMITSHNLRTPLTIINGYVDNFKLAKTKEDVFESLPAVQKGIRSLIELAENILTVSRLEMGERSGSNEPIEPAKVLAELIERLLPSFQEKKVTFTSKIEAVGAQLGMDEHQLKSAANNILSNALKFTPEGGSVTFSVNQVAGQLEIVVADSGIGISPEEQDKLFTKFHRGTSTMVYDYEGVGLGLYTTKLILEAYKGSISVSSVPTKGTTVTMHLPVLATV